MRRKRAHGFLCQNHSVPKRSSIGGRRDTSTLAFDIVQQATGQVEKDAGKNQAAVALGRLGGLKGGKARAAALTAEQRAGIARVAALARWKKQTKPPSSFL